MARPRSTDLVRLTTDPKSGIYILNYYVDGKRLKESTGTKELTKANGAKLQKEIELLNPDAPKDCTVADVLKLYASFKMPKVAQPKNLKSVLGRIEARIGGLRVAALNQKVIREYEKRRKTEVTGKGLRNEGQPPSDGSILIDLRYLRAAVKFAIAEGWVGIPESAHVWTSSIGQPEPSSRWLTPQEAQLFLERVKATPHLYLFTKLALHTYARSGALCRLKWKDVDLEARLINFPRGRFANKRTATVPISDDLYDLLVASKKIACSENVIEYKGRPLRTVRSGFYKAVMAMCQSLGMEPFSPHALRHTAATWAIMAGVSTTQVARMMGDTEAMVERVYGKHTPDFLREAAASTDRALANVHSSERLALGRKANLTGMMAADAHARYESSMKAAEAFLNNPVPRLGTQKTGYSGQ